MAKRNLAWRGCAHAAVAMALTGLLAACGSETPPEAAPVIMKGAEQMPPGPAAMAPAAGHVVVVRPGQSVRGIARAHHVPVSAIIAANHLAPPYKIEGGQRLLIPGPGMPPIEHFAAVRPAPPPTLAERHEPPRERGHMPPEIIPLDGPAPPAAAKLTPPAEAESHPSPPEKAPAPSADAGPAAASDRSAQLPHGSRFPWPVHGRVLAGYGVGKSGAHNDGINIAAPKGAPVEAVDGGVVAYAGNELRGYGNLVLVKHPNGWISAYAHCEQLLVKRGDRVSRGQVIAKVGETGGVSEPQLHFELRRGQRPVDPREFLAPAPSAAADATVHRG
jgi:murein DD-endopeptidase MepM/ murein hydrolase activator NlpD